MTFMNRFICCLIVAAIGQVDEGQAALIAGWDFQTTSGGGTAVAASPSTPTVFAANVGTGTLYLNGTNGSSAWAQASELNAFTGTNVNATNGLSSVTTSPAALAPLGGTGNSANGKSMVFVVSMTGLQDLTLTYAAQRTGTGFTDHAWEFSSDASTWTSWGSFTSGSAAGTLASGFATSGILSLPATSLLDNATNAYLRVTLSGATNSSGNNRLDNIQITAVPEPANLVVAGSVGLCVGAAIRRRTRS